MKRMSTQDCITLFNKDTSSPYVIICADHNSGNRAASFNIAYEGGFLKHISDGYYQCKRIVATNLSLVIMSDYPLTIK